jgi:WD40 repeat protein
MGIADQQTQQKFPFSYDEVFDALLVILPRNWSWTLKSKDRLLGRLAVSTVGSFFSYGENLTIKLEKIDDSNTLLIIESSLKVGMNIAGAHRHMQNFETIIAGLSHYLQHEKDMPPPVVVAAKPLPEETPEERAKKKRQIKVWLGVGALFVLGILGLVIYTNSKDPLTKTLKESDVPYAVSLAPGNQIAIGQQKEIELVDFNTGIVRQKFEFPAKLVRSIDFSPDNSLMAAGGGEVFGNGNLTIWNLQSHSIVQRKTFQSEVDSVSFSPDGKLLAFTASDKFVHLLNVQTGAEEQLSGHTDETLAVAFAPGGNSLFSAAGDGTIKIWDIQTKKVMREFKDREVTFGLSANGSLLASEGKKRGTVDLFSVETGELLRSITWGVPEKYEIRGISFCGDSKLLAIGGGEDLAKPGEIRIYEVESGNLRTVLKGHPGMVLDISCKPQTQTLVSTSAVVKGSNEVYGEVNVWNVSKF